MVFFETAREITEENSGSVVRIFYIIFLPLFGDNNIFAEKVQCQVYEMITKINFHWQPCALLFIKFFLKLFVDFNQTDFIFQRFSWFDTFSNLKFKQRESQTHY